MECKLGIRGDGDLLTLQAVQITKIVGVHEATLSR